MPPLPGETLLTTLFADVHYFFNPPSSKPVHDRFDKASYVYLYHNATQRRARLEVANAAGTPDQDAFHGNLDSVVVTNRYQHPTLFSLAVDALPCSPSFAHRDQAQWYLPTFDLKREQRALCRIHSIDIYLWTVNDSTLFLDSLKRILGQQHFDLVEMPTTEEHQDAMSPVVDQLEKLAIDQHSRPSPPPDLAAPSFVPYNPAAPAAPEPIAHREKTPPPVDASAGNGLTMAATDDYAASLAAPPPLTQHLSYQQSSSTPAFMPPPHRTSSSQSLPPPPPLSSSSNLLPGSLHPNPANGPSFATPFSPASSSSDRSALQQPSDQPRTQYAAYPHPKSTDYVPSPGLPTQPPGIPLTPGAPPSYGQITPLQSPSLPPPPPGPVNGTYPNYVYSPQTQTHMSQSQEYNMHHQVYRPTEAETAHGHSMKPAQPAKPGRFEDRVGKFEKGVNRFLRKLDK